MRESLAFDDVLLVPEYSEGRSRLSVNTSTVVGTVELDIPMIASPMDTVSEADMMVGMGYHGGMAVLHRFMTPLAQIRAIRGAFKKTHELNLQSYLLVVPAIGVNKEERERAKTLYKELGEDIDMFSIDIANGYSIQMREMVDYVLQLTHGEIPIMAGNVATVEGYSYLAEAGVNAVRVGIGGGSICKTRIQTGFGVPTLASLLDCKHEHLNVFPEVSIIADGGIRYPADLVKSLVAGADAVICGSIFAGTKEAPGNIIYDNNGDAWKSYRGMASEEVQIDFRGGLKPGTCAEGVSQLVRYKGSLERVLNEFTGGLRSGMTYANAQTIQELRKVKMDKITSSGISESHAMGTRK
jgi:IMP dehydrogenase